MFVLVMSCVISWLVGTRQFLSSKELKKYLGEMGSLDTKLEVCMFVCLVMIICSCMIGWLVSNSCNERN